MTQTVSLLLIGDPHFKVSNTRETTKFAAKSIKVAKRYKPDAIIDLGDTLDRHETIHVNPLTQATEWLQGLAGLAPTYVLIGNHDRPNNGKHSSLSTLHPFNALKTCPNIIVVDKAISVNIKGANIVMVPYTPPGNFKEAMTEEKIDYKSAVVIMAHQEFEGAKMGAIVSTVGDKWSTKLPPVFSGHIHDYDELQSNLTYVGTPFQQAFGDHSDKALMLLKFTLVDDKWVQTTIERINLNLPKKIVHKIHVDEVSTFEPDLTQENKIEISGGREAVNATMKSSNVKKWIAAGIKVVTKGEIITTPVQPLKNGLASSKTYKQVLKINIKKHSHKEELLKLYAELIDDSGTEEKKE